MESLSNFLQHFQVLRNIYSYTTPMRLRCRIHSCDLCFTQMLATLLENRHSYSRDTGIITDQVVRKSHDARKVIAAEASNDARDN